MIRVLAKASNTAAVPSFARTIATAGAASARSAAADHPGAGGLVADRWTLPTAPSAGGSSGAAAVGVVLFWAMPGKGKDVVVVEHHGGRRTASEAAGGGALFQATAVNGVPFRGKVGVLGEPIPVQCLYDEVPPESRRQGHGAPYTFLRSTDPVDDLLQLIRVA
ncbi:Os07g0146975 [Oryza sativa Japonica Group]|uniref:Os07g0146975 protein n=1 Tax=Oryza sativa subsp. japonica TaxID=39947 RepID=A0A0P0X319_ORYSJ|nr:Os07g0146975 [Oryza sativa Japonica Group]